MQMVGKYMFGGGGGDADADAATPASPEASLASPDAPSNEGVTP